MSDDAVRQVEDACAELIVAGEPVTFTAVASRSGIGRATLYRNRSLRAVIEEHRARSRDAHTLSGLATQVSQLRTSLEAVAAKVRRHDEVLRRLTKGPSRRSTGSD